MTTCTLPSVLSDYVDDLTSAIEERAQDDTLEGIDSSSYETSLDELNSYKEAIKNNDRDYIVAHGNLNEAKAFRSELATRSFLNTLNNTFFFGKKGGPPKFRGTFINADVVDGGVKINFRHSNGNKDHFTFSLTGGGRSTNKGNDFINIENFGSFLDDYHLTQERQLPLSLLLGSEPNIDFKLDKEALEDSYIHGNVEHMKTMLKKLHVMGGEKADDSELEGYLDLIERMKPEFFDKLKLYVQDEAEKSAGVVTPSRIDIKIKGDPISIGNQQSEASIYMEEVAHSMTASALNSKTPEAAKIKRQLDYLIELGRDQLSWESFLPDPKDSIDAVREKAFAKKLYDYIFKSENYDYEFLAKGIVQPAVVKALSTVMVVDKKENLSLLERLQAIFSSIMDVLTGNVSLKNKNGNVHDALVTLAYDLGTINSRKSQKLLSQPSFIGRVLDIVINDPDRYISDKLHEISQKAIGEVSKSKYTDPPKTLYGRTVGVAKALSLSLVNPNYTKVMGAIATAWGLKPDGMVREIVSGLFESGPAQQVAEFLVLQAGYIDKARNEQIGLNRDNILSSFKEPPTKEEEEALTIVFADTDLNALVGKQSAATKAGILKNTVFDNSTIRELLSDEVALDKHIKNAKRALKEADSTHYNWHSNQAVGLGIYMAKHQGSPSQNKNSHNIAIGQGSSHKKAPNKKVMEAIDELATLQAIKNTDMVSRLNAAELMKKDWQAVQKISDILDGFKKNSAETVFKKSKTNQIKGYTREIFDSSIQMEVGLLSDRQSMEDQGYTFKGNLPTRVGDRSRKKMALYVTDSLSRPERLRGGVRLNQIRSKGTTVTQSQYIEGKEFSSKVIRERAIRDINEIEKVAIADAKSMEAGTYDFKDAMFGVTPVTSDSGKVVDYTYMMDKKTKKELLKQDTRISEVMAKSFGSLVDKDLSAQHNAKVLDTIKDEMEKNWEKGSKGKDGLTDYTLIGPKVASEEMRNLYNMLPREFQTYITAREDKTMAVPTSLRNMYFGYTQLSIMDFPGLKKVTPKVLEKYIKFAESMWMELSQIAKTNILMKMPTVTISNFLSNSLYLLMKGYDPYQVLKLQVDSFKEIKSYNKKTKRKQELLNLKRELVVGLNRENIPARRKEEIANQLVKVTGELVSVEKGIKGSRIDELIQLGLDQTVEDINTSGTGDNTKIGDFFDKRLEKLPSVARTGIDYLFLTKRTAPYKVVNEFLEITDLMARDIQNTMEQRTEEQQARGDKALPRWWLDKQEKGYSRKKALSVTEKAAFLKEAKSKRQYDLVQDYINYPQPSSSFEEYLNKINILMFTKYVKRIQRIIGKSASEGLIKTIAVLTLAGSVLGVPTIHDQSFLAKEWYSESLGQGNVFPIYAPTDTIMNVLTPSLLKASTRDFGY